MVVGRRGRRGGLVVTGVGVEGVSRGSDSRRAFLEGLSPDAASATDASMTGLYSLLHSRWACKRKRGETSRKDLCSVTCRNVDRDLDVVTSSIVRCNNAKSSASSLLHPCRGKKGSFESRPYEELAMRTASARGEVGCTRKRCETVSMRCKTYCKSSTSRVSSTSYTANQQEQRTISLSSSHHQVPQPHPIPSLPLLLLLLDRTGRPTSERRSSIDEEWTDVSWVTGCGC